MSLNLYDAEDLEHPVRFMVLIWTLKVGDWRLSAITGVMVCIVKKDNDRITVMRYIILIFVSNLLFFDIIFVDVRSGLLVIDSVLYYCCFEVDIVVV